MNEQNERLKQLENSLKTQLKEIRTKMYSINNQTKRYANTIRQSLESMEKRQQKHSINLKANDMSIVGHFVVLRYCLPKSVESISVNLKCLLSIHNNSNELFVKMSLPLTQTISFKITFNDKTIARVLNYSIDWNHVFRLNANPFSHQFMRPFQNCITFNIKSNQSLNRFDFSKLNHCKTITEANCEISLMSNTLSIHFTRFTYLLMILKWINTTIDSSIKFIEDKNSNQVIQRSLKNELTFVANIHLNKNDYRNVRKELFVLEMATDRLMCKFVSK